MKLCTRCRIEKPLSEFSKDRKNSDGLQNWCKECQRPIVLANYYKRKSNGVEQLKWPQRAQAQREKRHKIMRELISMLGGKCQKCGYSQSIAAIDFHHVNPKEKKSQIGRLVWFLKTNDAIKEADKTVLLCSNCHREFENEEWSAEFVKADFGYQINTILPPTKNNTERSNSHIKK